MMRSRPLFALSAGILAACGPSAAAQHVISATALPAPIASNALRPLSSFASILDRADRSRALFAEATRVMLHPRCANCHPNGESPTQGDAMLLHDPPVARGDDDHGIPGLRCTSCHQDHNLELARVPGAPKWGLAPKVMAWVGRTPRALCEQVKDPARNGGKTLGALVDHFAHDPLVAWGWAPGSGRTPAPGSQSELGALVAAWVETGAECPLQDPSKEPPR